MTTTRTATQANTFTEARAREVMRQVHGDFMNWASAGFIGRERAQQIVDDLEYAVLQQVVETFQVQLVRPDGEPAGLSYMIRDDGSILEESKAGGFNPYNLPTGTKLSVCLQYRSNAAKRWEVDAYLNRRGWQNNGQLLEGGARDRAYSQDGFGAERIKIGAW